MNQPPFSMQNQHAYPLTFAVMVHPQPLNRERMPKLDNYLHNAKTFQKAKSQGVRLCLVQIHPLGKPREDPRDAASEKVGSVELKSHFPVIKNRCVRLPSESKRNSLAFFGQLERVFLKKHKACCLKVKPINEWRPAAAWQCKVNEMSVNEKFLMQFGFTTSRELLVILRNSSNSSLNDENQNFSRASRQKIELYRSWHGCMFELRTPLSFSLITNIYHVIGRAEDASPFAFWTSYQNTDSDTRAGKTQLFWLTLISRLHIYLCTNPTGYAQNYCLTQSYLTRAPSRWKLLQVPQVQVLC